MLETDLAIALGEFVEDALKDTRYPTKDGCEKPPKVVDGYLPPKRTDTEDDYPIVRAEDGTSEMGRTMVTVSLIVGCYSTETDGYARCLEIMQKLRLALCQMECQTLDRRYQLSFPITWSNVSEQPYPYWQIVMTTKWVFNTPQLTNF